MVNLERTSQPGASVGSSSSEERYCCCGAGAEREPWLVDGGGVVGVRWGEWLWRG